MNFALERHAASVDKTLPVDPPGPEEFRLNIIITLNIHLHWKKCMFVLPAVSWRFQRFMQKHRKWTARLPLSARCFLIAQAGFFYMLYYNSRGNTEV